MKELGVNQKVKVVKLFLTSHTYDQIALEVGIAKGSVVNIIDEFRDGKLPIPTGMAEYVDELRHLVVEMKKHNANVPELKSYLKVYLKLQEMGAAAEEAAHWLEVCQSLASPLASTNQLLKAAIELVELESASGQTYSASVENYKLLEEHRKELEETIATNQTKIAALDANYQKAKKGKTEELAGINEAIAKAQESFLKQTEELKTQLNIYMANVKLSWHKVKVVQAIFESNSAKSGLGKADIELLSHNF